MRRLSIQTIFWQLMTEDMNLSYSQLNSGISANNAGLAVGCLFFIPFAKKYGRRSPYVISLAVMAATSFWSARMTTATELYLTNLFQGLAGAINETIVEMTVSCCLPQIPRETQILSSCRFRTCSSFINAGR